MIATECCDSCDNFTEMDAGNYPTCLVDKKHFKRKLMGSRCDLYTPRNPIENPLKEKDKLCVTCDNESDVAVYYCFDCSKKEYEYVEKLKKKEKMWEELKAKFEKMDKITMFSKYYPLIMMSNLEKENE